MKPRQRVQMPYRILTSSHQDLTTYLIWGTYSYYSCREVYLNVTTRSRFSIFYKVIEPWKWGQGQMKYDWSARSYRELAAHQI